MTLLARLTPLLAALIALAACRSTRPVIDPSLASCVPANTVALAGLDLDQLRASSLYRSLPPNALTVVQAMGDASYLLIASNGQDLLFLARGKFREAPPGATLIGNDLAIAGPAASVRAAIAQHQTGSTGSRRLLDLAAGIAAGRQVWMVAQGGVTLPLAGNVANLNRILRLADYVTVAAQIDSQFQFHSTATCRTAEAARQLEESLRAILTFATAAAGRQSGITPILKSLEIRRDDLTVSATLSTTPESAEKLMRELRR